MTLIEIILTILLVSWNAALAGAGVRLVRAGPEEQESAQRTLSAVIIAGVVITIGPTIITWLTGYQKHDVNGEERWCAENPKNSDEPTNEICLPAEVTTIFDKLINGLKAIGAIVLIVGMIWGGIKLQASYNHPDRRGCNCPHYVS